MDSPISTNDLIEILLITKRLRFAAGVFFFDSLPTDAGRDAVSWEDAVFGGEKQRHRDMHGAVDEHHLIAEHRHAAEGCKVQLRKNALGKFGLFTQKSTSQSDESGCFQ